MSSAWMAITCWGDMRAARMLDVLLGSTVDGRLPDEYSKPRTRPATDLSPGGGPPFSRAWMRTPCAAEHDVDMAYPPEGADPRGPLAALARFGWHSALTGGLVAVLLGIVVLAWPGRTLVVLGVLFGLYLIVAGVAQVVGASAHGLPGGLRALGLISGALSILLGLFCFRSAFQSVLLLGIWIGIGWLFRGVSATFAALDAPSMPGRGWAIFLSAATALAGIVLITDPIGSLATLAVLSGIWLVILGGVEIGHGLTLRSKLRG